MTMKTVLFDGKQAEVDQQLVEILSVLLETLELVDYHRLKTQSREVPMDVVIDQAKAVQKIVSVQG